MESIKKITLSPKYSNRNKTIGVLLYIFLSCGLLLDLTYSFIQHYNEPLDGDMAESILPLDYIQPLYTDPFGVKMMAKQEPHAAPNRFFSHYLFYKTYHSLPFALQKITDPIHSLYYSNAICKIIMQILLILLTCSMICGGFHFKSIKFMLSAVIFSAFLQTCGFTRSIGLIDPAITYSFFYALPLIFLLFYLQPFVYKEFHNKSFIKNRLLLIIYETIFLLLTCFSGAINPAIAIIAVFTLFIRYLYKFLKYKKSEDTKFWKTLADALKKMPKHYYSLLPLFFISLYALYLGRYNTMWTDESITLLDRYMLLPKGLLEMFIGSKGGFGLLFILCSINYILLRLYCKEKKGNCQQLFHWILVFSAIYLLLLPFGGYRPYRPFIIRYDSALPVSYLFILFELVSTIHILKHSIEGKLRISNVLYLLWTCVAVGFFFLYDTPRTWRNDLEMKAMIEIQDNPSDTIQLTSEPTCIISWKEPESIEESEKAGKLLYFWKVTDKEKRFYFTR